ncbi:MAG: hypothetical protein HW416_1530, partial [Chloroflexi bacterium]|nr:hypothetical protein [Chloroflexota bacterium]
VLLDTLHGRSLLVRAERSGQTRYRLLPTVRDYARGRLGRRAEKSERRYAGHYLQVLELADGMIRAGPQREGIERIAADLDNVRAGIDVARRLRDWWSVVRYSRSFSAYLSVSARFAEDIEWSRYGLAAAEALADPTAIADCQNNLGAAYRNLPSGDRGENVRRAIACHEAALRVCTESEFPVQWATTQNNLGVAYGDLPSGDRGENVRRAIACYEAARRGYRAGGLQREAENVSRGLRPLLKRIGRFGYRIHSFAASLRGEEGGGS